VSFGVTDSLHSEVERVLPIMIPAIDLSSGSPPRPASIRLSKLSGAANWRGHPGRG